MSITYSSKFNGDIEILMTPKEPKYILDLLGDDEIMVEWGSGGSTIYFLDNLKPDQTLISIEHNLEWFEKMTSMIETHPNKDSHIYLYIPSEFRNNHYATPEEETPAGLNQYIIFDRDIIARAKVFLVDGVARGPIAAMLANLATENSHVIIHDYLGREQWYNWVTHCYKESVQPEDTVLVHMKL